MTDIRDYMWYMIWTMFLPLIPTYLVFWIWGERVYAFITYMLFAIFSVILISKGIDK